MYGEGEGGREGEGERSVGEGEGGREGGGERSVWRGRGWERGGRRGARERVVEAEGERIEE